MKIKYILISFIVGCLFSFNYKNVNAQEPWWLDEPLRMIQTNIPIQMYQDYKADELIGQLHDKKVNCWLVNVGGIYANYPTGLKYQQKNPYIKDDFIKIAVNSAHQKDMKVIARFDFSRFAEYVAEAHPEWCFRRENGDSINFNGLVTSCINSDYYRSYGPKMVEEALKKYDFDGIFVNWWGNAQGNWYSGIPNGTCHCQNCLDKWKKFSDEPMPGDPYAENYRKFMNMCDNEAAASLREKIKSIDLSTAFILYHGANVFSNIDGFTTESRTNYTPNIWWPYESSYMVNKYRNNYPDKMIFNTVVNFLNFNYRFAPHRKLVNQTRMIQSMAHGAFPALYMVGALDEMNETLPYSFTFPFNWHSRHESLYHHQHSAAQVAIIDDYSENTQGLIMLLSELHIPFKIYSHIDHIKDWSEVKLLLAHDNIDFRNKIKDHAKVIVFGTSAPDDFKNRIIKLWSEDELRKSYWKVNDTSVFNDLKNIEYVFHQSNYLEIMPEAGDTLLTLVPPAISSPTEIAFVNKQESDKPGILFSENENYNLAYIPWYLPEMYFSHASESLRLLFKNTIDYLIADQYQLQTNAHPLVEFSLMEQDEYNRQLLHMINLSGQLHGSQDQHVPFNDIEIKIRGNFKSAELASSGKQLELNREGEFAKVKVPVLEKYEVIILNTD